MQVAGRVDPQPPTLLHCCPWARSKYAPASCDEPGMGSCVAGCEPWGIWRGWDSQLWCVGLNPNYFGPPWKVTSASCLPWLHAPPDARVLRDYGCLLPALGATCCPIQHLVQTNSSRDWPSPGGLGAACTYFSPRSHGGFSVLFGSCDGLL